MGKINDVRDLIVANPGIERSALVGLVAEKFSVTRALAHSYVYHASKKSAKGEAKSSAAKITPIKTAASTAMEKAAKVDLAKEKNLETIKKVAAKKAKAKANAKIERVTKDFDPQLMREEVEAMINESIPKEIIPKIFHKECGFDD